jgi:hypothetical protein
MARDREKGGEGRTAVCLLEVSAYGVDQWVTGPEGRGSYPNGSGTTEREILPQPWAHRLFEIERDVWPGRIPWEESNDTGRWVVGLDVDAVEPLLQGPLEGRTLVESSKEGPGILVDEGSLVETVVGVDSDEFGCQLLGANLDFCIEYRRAFLEHPWQDRFFEICKYVLET